MTPRALLLGSAMAFVACTHALREPPPVDRIGTDILATGAPPAAPGEVGRLLAEGEAQFFRRPDHEAARAAQRAYLEAARADSERVEGLIGLARVTVWRIEHAASEEERKALVPVALQAAQWCRRRLPADPRCDYWLAIALGLQAREQPSTGHDGVKRMVEALRRAIGGAPDLEEAGPHRVLALVLLRAPGWPLGPGDPEAGLFQAREAVARFPDHPPNQLALGEALRRNGQDEESRAAYLRARERAEVLSAAGDPDAPEWGGEAVDALARP